MAIAVNATDAFSGGSAAVKATSATATIPAGAGIGDVIFLVFNATNLSTSASTTLSVTSTGNAWTQIGSTETCAISSFSYIWSSLWWLKVQAADQGATVTLHSTTSLYLGAAAAGYSGVNSTSPVDGYAFNATTAGEETWASPTTTASVSTDWLLNLAGIASTQTIATPAGPGTSRQTYFAYNEFWTGLSDSNGTVAAGTVGGGNFTSGYYSGLVTWTLAISGGNPAIALADSAGGTDALAAQVASIPVVLITAPPVPAGPPPPQIPARILTVQQGAAVPQDQAAADDAVTAVTAAVPLADFAGAADVIAGGVFSADQAAAAEALAVTAVTASLADLAAVTDLQGAIPSVQAAAQDYGASADSSQTTGLTEGDQAGASENLAAAVTVHLADTAGAADGYGTEPAIGASGGSTYPRANPGTSQVAVAAPGSSRWYYLGSIGQVTALTYSFACPGGCDQMTCTVMVPASYRNQAFFPGWQVRITRGGHVVWDGKMDEPVPTSSGWTFTAVGTGMRGADFVAVYSDTWPTGQPDESVNNAISRGLPWVNPGVGTPSYAWYGQAVDSGAQTITALLNLICTRGGSTWYVNSQPGGYPGDDLSVFPLPTVPNRLLICVTPVPRTLGGDINTIWLRYQTAAASTGSGGSGTATYGTTSVQNAASVAMHGVIETYIDLSDVGVQSAAQAQAVGSAVLEIYQRASFAGPFTGSYGQLTTMGGTPVDPGTDQAGTVVRLILTDFGYGGEVVPGPVQFITGAYSWDDFTQVFTITPYQALDQSLTGLLQMTNTTLTPITTASTG